MWHIVTLCDTLTCMWQQKSPSSYDPLMTTECTVGAPTCIFIMVTLHFVPGHFISVILSPGQFVPSHFVPGHFEENSNLRFFQLILQICSVSFLVLLSPHGLLPREREKERERERIGVGREGGRMSYFGARNLGALDIHSIFWRWRKIFFTVFRTLKCKDKQDITILCISGLFLFLQVTQEKQISIWSHSNFEMPIFFWID
jgi:hypothetical protein